MYLTFIVIPTKGGILFYQDEKSANYICFIKLNG